MTTLVLLGLDCHFTRGLLAALADHGVRPTLLVLPGPPGAPLTDAQPARPTLGRTLQMAPRMSPTTPTVLPLHALAASTVRVGDLRDPALVARVATLQPDAIAVACYLQRVPRALRHLAPLAVNVHPSLLPRHRGPDPLFWTFHAGDGFSGVTIHDLAHGFDQGDIRTQARVSLPLDADEHSLEADLAQRGGMLLASLLARNDGGTTPQNEAQATYETWPTDDDLRITAEWTTRRAWRCLHGLRDRHLPFRFVGEHGTVAIDTLVRLGTHSDPTPPPQPGERLLTFVDGWLLVRIRPE